MNCIRSYTIARDAYTSGKMPNHEINFGIFEIISVSICLHVVAASSPMFSSVFRDREVQSNLSDVSFSNCNNTQRDHKQKRIKV